ncbi:MAG: hypothetical protein COV44_02550 [Deltaproteobacteria bacterium CG11_big_fil_rev_8_21_14_0_20_45_16]|nr:MAG: hypothetical protein COV44_02550 [Deltaproteobacteria bacterium CG11_big_fil_rev_8_21_14_0_20_45_16]
MSGFKISGLGSGIDFSAYVQAIISAEQQKAANTIGKREIVAQSAQLAYNNVKGALQSLSALIKGFKFSDGLKVKTAKSSDSEVFTGTAQLSALVQSVQLRVESLANNEVSRTSFTGVENIVHSGVDTTITITVRGEPHTVDVPSGSKLSDLVGLINSAKIGVTAASYDSGDGTATPARLTITDNLLGDPDNNAGTDNISVDLSNLDAGIVDPTVVTTAVNTGVIINGESVTTDSHTLADVIPGVTLKLLSADPGVDKTLTVQESTADASKNVENMLNKYNEVVALIRQTIQYDPNAETQTNLMAGDATLRNVLTRLQSSITSTVSSLPESVSIRSLADLGVKTLFDGDNGSTNGQMNFEPTVFNQKINTSYDDLIKFFEGFTEDSVTYKGFADTMTDVMDSFLAAPNGSIISKLSSLDSQLRQIADEKQKVIERILAHEEALTMKFARLEGQLSKLNSQGSALTSALESVALNSKAIANRSK